MLVVGGLGCRLASLVVVIVFADALRFGPVWVLRLWVGYLVRYVVFDYLRLVRWLWLWLLFL